MRDASGAAVGGGRFLARVSDRLRQDLGVGVVRAERQGPGRTVVRVTQLLQCARPFVGIYLGNGEYDPLIPR